MLQKFVLIVATILLASSVTAVNNSERSLDTKMKVESNLNSEMKRSIDAREKTKRTSCGLKFSAGADQAEGGLKASLTCPENNNNGHTDNWINAELIREYSSQAPQDIALVTAAERCSAERVCYQLTGGSIDVTVVNDPPSVREEPVSEDKKEDREMESVAIVGYGSFSISNKAEEDTNISREKEASPNNASDIAIANRLLASLKSSNCPETGERERCLTNTLSESKIYSEISAGSENIKIWNASLENPVISSGDCDDSDPNVRPEVCGETTHFSYPDLDGDGFGDIAVEKNRNTYNWKIQNETVANSKVVSARAADTRIIFLQVYGSQNDLSSRGELIEAIASKSGLSKADSSRAVNELTDLNVVVALRELDKSSPYIYNSRPDDRVSSDIDKASPKLQEELVRKDKRIAELKTRIQELESDVSINSSSGSVEGNDMPIRKKPGRAEGIDADSDNDGLSDGTEEETAEPVRRPGFVDRLLSSVLG